MFEQIKLSNRCESNTHTHTHTQVFSKLTKISFICDVKNNSNIKAIYG